MIQILKNKFHLNHKNLTIIFNIVVTFFFMIGCNKEKPEIIQAITDRAATPNLHATDVTTIVSDSGITRYRISAPEWDIYDKAAEPYWEFPYGIHLERFDLNLKVDANIHSKYAKYYINQKLWELRGNVKATNLKGELFETEQLFWDQNSERIYSDSLIKVTRPTQIINAIGFESDQSMNYYVFHKVKGIFPYEESQDSFPPNPQQTEISPSK